MHASKLSTSVVHICGAHTDGSLQLEKQVLGDRPTDLFGGADRLLVQLHSGVLVDVLARRKAMDASVVAMGFGKSHSVACSSAGALYSWGVGDFGELGLGSKTLVAHGATEIKLAGQMKNVACGEFHSCALDDKGNMYSWGQNFDRQLGLYKKKKEEMNIYSNCYIEDIILTPKYLPFSAENRVSFIACGARFTVAISSVGDVWTWGSGECGQLGTGRCTSREVPACCYRVNGREEGVDAAVIGNQPMTQVACGFAHVIGRTADGSMYGWGINKQGQLGLGDDYTRQKPTLLPIDAFKNAIVDFQTNVASSAEEAENILRSDDPKQYQVCKVFAGAHSSAAIDNVGRLFTWGSGANYRTMHNNTSVLKRPTLVYRLAKNEVRTFAFSESASAVLIFSRLIDISPKQGPLKSFSRITLYGCGFYPSEDIVVKFARVGVAFVAPRSSLGKYVKDGVITCRPPKFRETGEYSVSVSLDGTNFMNDLMTVHIYAEPSLLSATPTICDARSILDSGGFLNVVLVSFTISKNAILFNVLFYLRLA
jgi:alpha-tubulin suppressor-like RCC1 family protein